jgi:hypothetical protein
MSGNRERPGLSCVPEVQVLSVVRVSLFYQQLDDSCEIQHQHTEGRSAVFVYTQTAISFIDTTGSISKWVDSLASSLQRSPVRVPG